MMNMNIVVFVGRIRVLLLQLVGEISSKETAAIFVYERNRIRKVTEGHKESELEEKCNRLFSNLYSIYAIQQHVYALSLCQGLFPPPLLYEIEF